MATKEWKLTSDSKIAKYAVYLLIAIATAVLGFGVDAIAGNSSSSRQNKEDIRVLDTEVHNHIENADKMQTTIDEIRDCVYKINPDCR